MHRLEWIRVDTGSLWDDRLMQLRHTHGWEGEGIFWALVRIAAQNQGRLRKESLRGFAIQLGAANLEKVASFCVDVGLFRSDKKSIWSERLLREFEVAEDWKEKRQKSARIAGLASAKARSTPRSTGRSTSRQRPTYLPTDLPTYRPTDKVKGEPHGSHVRLTNEQRQALIEGLKGGVETLEDLVGKVNDYCASKGKRYKDWAATIRNWARKDKLWGSENGKKPHEVYRDAPAERWKL